ncbi:hypothetical protein IFM89_038018 [Coptis chinensis]|uniref:phosphoglycerate kinase n=1 Tax=Coptis chinensis TaxID=261450 RepID=A0A835LQM1_9MAGN|nr:hypothetical protein IFM89_038018 [Coptis chinensis]
MRLNNNSMSGPVPLSLVNMSQLAFLDFSYNNLSGPTPRFPARIFNIVGNPMICATGKEQECSGTTPLPLSFNLSSSQICLVRHLILLEGCKMNLVEEPWTSQLLPLSSLEVVNENDTRLAGCVNEVELDYLIGAVSNNPKRLFAAIIGGSKVSSKIGVIESLLEKVDILLLGGGMIFTFYKAQGNKVGSSLKGLVGK